jgi:signal transduction histidine kinase
MEERVTRLGGTFEARSEPGAGTLLMLELPLKEENTNRGIPKSEADSNIARG